MLNTPQEDIGGVPKVGNHVHNAPQALETSVLNTPQEDLGGVLPIRNPVINISAEDQSAVQEGNPVGNVTFTRHNNGHSSFHMAFDETVLNNIPNANKTFDVSSILGPPGTPKRNVKSSTPLGSPNGVSIGQVADLYSISHNVINEYNSSDPSRAEMIGNANPIIIDKENMPLESRGAKRKATTGRAKAAKKKDSKDISEKTQRKTRTRDVKRPNRYAESM